MKIYDDDEVKFDTEDVIVMVACGIAAVALFVIAIWR